MNDFTIERYEGRPQGASRFEWPTGFSGTGWLVRDASGTIVYAHAWRVHCLEYVEAQAVAA